MSWASLAIPATGAAILAALRDFGYRYVIHPAETAAGLTRADLTFGFDPGDARRYGARIDGATDDTLAYQRSLSVAAQSTSVEAYWPGGEAVVSTLEVTLPCKVRTAGLATHLKQKAGLAENTAILDIKADFECGTLQATGNIATDTGESMHLFSLGGAAPVTRVVLGDVYGTDIRGDLIYMGGTPANPLYNVRVGKVFGSNTYRNRVSVVGAVGVDIEAIDGSGGLGYRAIDVEPNPTNRQPDFVHVGYLRAANFQVAGGNLAGGVGRVRIDRVELDNSLIADAVPAYPSFPTAAGNIGIICGDAAEIAVGTMKARGFAERLLNSSANTFAQVIKIGCVDIADCDTAEATVKCLFNLDAFVTLRISRGVIAVAAVDRSVVKGNQGVYDFSDLTISGGQVASFCTGGTFRNLAIDANGVASPLFGTTTNSVFENITITNGGTATLMHACTFNTLTNVQAASLSGEGDQNGANFRINSNIAGIVYGANWIDASVAYDPPALANGAEVATTLAVPGAELGDFVLVAFSVDPTGVKLSGQVRVAGNVEARLTNNTGAAVDLGAGTLYARVVKRA